MKKYFIISGLVITTAIAVSAITNSGVSFARNGFNGYRMEDHQPRHNEEWHNERHGGVDYPHRYEDCPRLNGDDNERVHRQDEENYQRNMDQAQGQRQNAPAQHAPQHNQTQVHNNNQTQNNSQQQHNSQQVAPSQPTPTPQPRQSGQNHQNHNNGNTHNQGRNNSGGNGRHGGGNR